MPLPTIANVVRVALNWENTSDSRRATNVLHFERGDGALTLANFKAQLLAWTTGAMWTPVSTAARITECVVTPLYDTSASLTFNPDAEAGGVLFRGQTGGDWMPQVAALIKLTTDLRGKSNRGRVFLPWVAESAADSDGLTDAKRADTTAAWTTFANNMADSNWALGVASYRHTNWHQATNVGCEKLTATIRRRNRG